MEIILELDQFVEGLASRMLELQTQINSLVGKLLSLF